MNRVQEEYQAFFKNCMDACISYNEEMRQQCVKTVDNLSEISSSQIDMYIENLKGRLYGFKNNGKEGVSLMLESAVEGVKRVKSHIDHHKEGVRVRRNHFKRLMAGGVSKFR